MCGIIAYIGHRDATPLVLNGLKRLEYRGYDSSGIAVLNGNLQLLKRKGKIKDLELALEGTHMPGKVSIGHTRWATHGEPNDINAHPHISSDGKIAMVHNGIIENYDVIRKELLTKGYTLESETDTEVLLKFIESIKQENHFDLEEAVRIALKWVVGTYVIVLIDQERPNTLIAARKGSPLVVGIGDDEYFMASDALPIVDHTRDVVYINDYELVIIEEGELILKNLGNERKTPLIEKLDLEIAAIEKGGYEHFMLKEIYQQPDTIRDCFRGRITEESSSIQIRGIEDHLDKFVSARRIIMIGCGTSWHASLVAEYIFEDLCRIPVEVDYASEFRYRNPILDSNDIIFAISQSGETADTIVALEKAKEQNAFLFGIVNVVGSSISRITHAGTYTHSGPEIGVASTKAFTGQLAVLYMIALKVGLEKQLLSQKKYSELLSQLQSVPKKIETIFETQINNISSIAEKYCQSQNCLYLGRGYQFPIALEGALKLKEISYIHAEGYPAAEMKHGPIALIEDNVPVIFIALKNDECYEKIMSNIQEIKARRGKVIGIITEGDSRTKKILDEYIEIPECDPVISPLLTVVPLQFLAYYMGTKKGIDVDKPRNLAKSVTVE
ncbi:glutamine--fructose-6-phosphate transaminase (isomerizing) [Membranihabitans maritimus]|uniref:glutamine--fructose-6-phosphate transaminase (isomerizing) n=1 Tax=Membranihabitans maritimus TaxID=2904244 RepID=UPI001F02F772|nr:glutamine--fructose-6-phosphate transaminase (isomerizing) [Membranihabitans maritimus]